MNTVDIINKKRIGQALTADEIKFMVEGYSRGDIPDYQMSALLMAICIQGMTREETVILTEVMRDSGDRVDLSDIEGFKVDKHSTGGVGDKTTLIVAPIVASCDVPVAKMSGRGLGFTGGTVDKMESIPGFRTSMTGEEFNDAVNSRRIAVIGQTGQIAPADKKIYGLRDVTGTTESISLITASIMSKKLAAGSDGILLDVKCGQGAFMKTEEAAIELASWMVDIGRDSGKKMRAFITDMNQPLGRAVGNSLEVIEVMEVLKGKGPEDIRRLSLELAGAMIAMGKNTSMEEGLTMARESLNSGRALEKFEEFLAGQGGDARVITDYNLMPQPRYSREIKAGEGGFLQEVNAMTIGLASQHSGAGRKEKSDSIDMSAGIVLNKKIGDPVQTGDLLCTVYGNDIEKVNTGAKEAEAAFKIGIEKVEAPELIKRVII